MWHGHGILGGGEETVYPGQAAVRHLVKQQLAVKAVVLRKWMGEAEWWSEGCGRQHV